MTIEELNEHKGYLEYEREDEESNLPFEFIDAMLELIDSEIARQSVMDEDVREAIEHCEYALEDEQLESDGEWSNATFSTTALRTILTALQQMRTEGCHSCKGIESHGIKSVKTVTDKLGRDIDAYNTPYNYCPNCGRKLRGSMDIEFLSKFIAANGRIVIRNADSDSDLSITGVIMHEGRKFCSEFVVTRRRLQEKDGKDILGWTINKVAEQALLLIPPKES